MKRTVRFSVAFLLLFPVASFAFPSPDYARKIRKQIDDSLAKIAESKAPKVLVIPIREAIDLRTAVYVERHMETVKKEKVDLVLVDMHTPGGKIDAMDRICDVFMRSLDENGVPVVTFVNTDAFSAGGYICLSTDRIYMAKGGRMSAAMAIGVTPDGKIMDIPDDVAEKIRSLFTGKIRTIAKVKGYPAGLAESMVDRALLVKEYEIDGEREILESYEFDQRLRELKIDDAGSEAGKKRIKEIRTISKEGSLLTLDYDEARKVGLARAPFASRDAVLADLGLKSPQVIVAEHNRLEVLVTVLGSVVVVGFILGLIFRKRIEAWFERQ